MPDEVIEIVPPWFVSVMLSAQTAIGNANASNAITATRLIFVPSQIFCSLSYIPLTKGLRLKGIRRLYRLEHLPFQTIHRVVNYIFQQHTEVFPRYGMPLVAIPCTLATIPLPISLAQFRPGTLPSIENGNRLGSELGDSLQKQALRDGFQNQGAAGNHQPQFTHVTKVS